MGAKEMMVLRVRPTSARFSIYNLSTPADSIPLHVFDAFGASALKVANVIGLTKILS